MLGETLRLSEATGQVKFSSVARTLRSYCEPPLPRFLGESSIGLGTPNSEAAFDFLVVSLDALADRFDELFGDAPTN